MDSAVTEPGLKGSEPFSSPAGEGQGQLGKVCSSQTYTSGRRWAEAHYRVSHLQVPWKGWGRVHLRGPCVCAFSRVSSAGAAGGRCDSAVLPELPHT